MQDLNDKVNNGGASNAGKLFYNEWDEVASEIQNVITNDGTTLSSGVLTQLLAAIAQLSRGRSFWGTDSGTSSAYIVTSISNAATTLFTGLTIKFRPANNNSVVSPTVNFNSTGVKTITNEAGAPLVVGDINTLRDAELRYDGTNWRLLNRCLTLTQTGLFNLGYITGYYIQNDSVAPNTTIQVNAGSAADSSGTFNLILATNFKKRIDAVWALGGASAGGRPSTVGLTPNTFYRIFLIGGSSAATDFGFDTSSTALNLLADATTVTGNTYNKFRQIGWVLTNGSSNITKFFMDVTDFNTVYWDTVFGDIDSNNPGTARIIGTVTAPPSTSALLSVYIAGAIGGANQFVMDVRATSMSDVVPTRSNSVARLQNLGNAGTASDTSVIFVPVDSSRQIAYRFAELSGGVTLTFQYGISCRGYRYVR